MSKQFTDLIEIIKKTKIDLKFNIIEIGAFKYFNDKEPFYQLLNHFPSSKIIGFELEDEVCKKMNNEAQSGVKYYPYALGKSNEKRNLYITEHPMCSSLYEPNEELLDFYNGFKVAKLKEKKEIETITLDDFINKEKIEDIDFIKIDVQGAELDVLKGATNTIKNALKIVCEVEFIPLYKNQPLFGEVCNFLDQYNFMFNKFLGLEGRTLKPILINNNPNIASQHIWSDAVFIKHIEKINHLDDKKLLKLSLLSAIYRSFDLSFFCLSCYDKKHSSSYANDWISKVIELK